MSTYIWQPFKDESGSSSTGKLTVWCEDILCDNFKILNETVASTLENNYGEEVQETVKFIRMMNKFFDCLNVTNTATGLFSSKGMFQL